MALLPVGRQLTESVRWYTPRKMMNRFMLIPEVHLLLLRASKILLLRRYQTCYEDGNYSVVADHVDGNEPATVTVARETTKKPVSSLTRPTLCSPISCTEKLTMKECRCSPEPSSGTESRPTKSRKV